MKTGQFVSAEEVISEVTSYTADRSFRKGYSKNWYMARLRDAMNEMAVASYYFKVTTDVKIPKNLRLKHPENMFNIHEIYLFNTDSEGCCIPGSFQNVMWKRQFNNYRNPNQYSAKINETQTSSAYLPNKSDKVDGKYDYFANEHNDELMLDPRAAAYSHVRLVGNGYGSNPDQAPPVPRFMKQYVVAFICDRFFAAKTAENWRENRHIWKDWEVRRMNEETTARVRAMRSSKYVRESLSELETNLNVR
jgi:hypothetical protein